MLLIEFLCFKLTCIVRDIEVCIGHFQHGTFTDGLVPCTGFPRVEKQGAVSEFTIKHMCMAKKHYLCVGRHKKWQMHQFELGLGQFKVVRLLDKVVLVMYLMQVGIIIAINGNITQAAIYQLVQHLRFDDITGMNQKLSPVFNEEIDHFLGSFLFFMCVGEDTYFH